MQKSLNKPNLQPLMSYNDLQLVQRNREDANDPRMREGNFLHIWECDTAVTTTAGTRGHATGSGGLFLMVFSNLFLMAFFGVKYERRLSPAQIDFA